MRLLGFPHAALVRRVGVLHFVGCRERLGPEGLRTVRDRIVLLYKYYQVLLLAIIYKTTPP